MKAAAKSRPVELALSPVNNLHLANLCGPLDENLRQIETAKQTWGLEKQKTPEARPTEEELLPYLNGQMPSCPAGGQYTIGPLDEEAAAGELDQCAAQPVAERPQLLIRNEFGIGHALPVLGRVYVLVPLRAEPVLPEAAHRPFHPADQVDAVEKLRPDIYGVLRNKYYIDEVYEVTFVSLNAWWARAACSSAGGLRWCWRLRPGYPGAVSRPAAL